MARILRHFRKHRRYTADIPKVGDVHKFIVKYIQVDPDNLDNVEVYYEDFPVEDEQ